MKCERIAEALFFIAITCTAASALMLLLLCIITFAKVLL